LSEDPITKPLFSGYLFWTNTPVGFEKTTSASIKKLWRTFYNVYGEIYDTRIKGANNILVGQYVEGYNGKENYKVYQEEKLGICVLCVKTITR